MKNIISTIILLYPITQKVAGYYVIPSEPFECPSVSASFPDSKARNPYARMRMRVLIRKYQNPKIHREGILIYGYVCVYV